MAKLSAHGRIELCRLTITNGKYTYIRVVMSDRVILEKMKIGKYSWPWRIKGQLTMPLDVYKADHIKLGWSE